MGINGVDTLQPEAKEMSPEYLKKHFGGRLFFHGWGGARVFTFHIPNAYVEWIG